MKLSEIVEAANAIDGWMMPTELEWLAKAASDRKTIIEVGSWKGRSTKALAMATLGVVYAVDHWKGSLTELGTYHEEAAKSGPDAIYDLFKANLADELKKGGVVPVRSESSAAVVILAQSFMSHGRGPGLADMIFIDAEHTYESVSRDIHNYNSLLASGGLLCGHDYQHPEFAGIKRAVDELVPCVRVMDHGTIWYAVKP